MENKNTDKQYFYDNKYLTLDEISELYKRLSYDKKKIFKDSMAHYTLAEILRRCNYDKRMINTILEIAGDEVDRMNLIGTDCGRPLLGYERRYKSKLRKLINLTGKIVNKDDDSRMNRFINGEWFLNNLVCLTIGSSFEKDIIDDLVLIDYNFIGEDECLAIADNFVRNMNDEEIVFYNRPKRLIKK